MSDSESFAYEIITDSDDDMPTKPVNMNVTYGKSTIPLHPILARQYDILITEENRYTFEQTPASVEASVINWGPSIGYVRDEFITYELCVKAIENCRASICSIKPHLLSKPEYYNLCLQSVKENGWNAQYIPTKVQTQEFVDAAIKSSCGAIQFCLNKFKTYDNCFSAVQRNGQSIEHVPNKWIDPAMCMAAAKSRYPCLHLIPKEFITMELCEEAVKGDGVNIKYVPDEFMSSELGWLAIISPAPSHPCSTMAGSNVKYIPAKYLTKEIIVESAKRWFCTYNTIPKECITEEIEDAVLEVSPYCIKYMKQTPERCLKALKICPYIIESYIGTYIEKENINCEMATYVLSLDDEIKNRIDDDTLEYLKSFI
jgi:hypothetical protein